MVTKNIAVIGLAVVFSAMFVGFTSTTALGSMDDDSVSVNLCGDGMMEGDAEDTAQTMRDIFAILQALGPVFGTLFFAGMSVADAAKTKAKYDEQRRKVLLLGFGVPVAIVFLESIAQTLMPSGTDISCFFPG